MVNENQTPVEAEKVSIEDNKDEVNGNEVNEKEPKDAPEAAAGDIFMEPKSCSYYNLYSEDKTKTVQELINKVKNDTNMANSSKMDTLAILVMRFVEENSEYDFDINFICYI